MLYRRTITIFCTLTLAFLLSACAGPVTRPPSGASAEYRRERAVQQELTSATVNMDDHHYRYGRKQEKAFLKRLEKVVAKLNPAAQEICRSVGPRSEGDCNLHVQLVTRKKGINAYSDGKIIAIQPGVVEFAEKDEHLALIVAHEYAHHFLGHPNSKGTQAMLGSFMGSVLDNVMRQQGIATGGDMQDMGEEMGVELFSPALESEADYIAAYIVANAGYGLESLPEFWRRMAVAFPKNVSERTTHPTTPERYVQLVHTLDEIKEKRRNRQALVPNMQAQQLVLR